MKFIILGTMGKHVNGRSRQERKVELKRLIKELEFKQANLHISLHRVDKDELSILRDLSLVNAKLETTKERLKCCDKQLQTKHKACAVEYTYKDV